MSRFSIKLVRRHGQIEIAIVDAHTRRNTRLFVQTLLDARDYVS